MSLNLQFRKAIPSMMRVKKSSNGWANLMVRATELSIPANRKTLRLVSLFVIHVKAQSTWKEPQKLLKTRRFKKSQLVIRVYLFFFFTVVICGIIMIHPAGLREKLSSNMLFFIYEILPL
ncbi:unnamed protein product [Brassica rapa subsp. trilocularis]